MSFEFQVVWPGSAGVLVGGREILMRDGDEAFACGDGNRFEQNGIHQREDGGVDADPECDGDDYGEGTPPMGAQHAQGETNIFGHRIEAGAPKEEIAFVIENARLPRVGLQVICFGGLGLSAGPGYSGASARLPDETGPRVRTLD